MMRLAVFASGEGSNFGALIRAARRQELGATLALLVTDREEAGAISRAQDAGIPHVMLLPRPAETFGERLLATLKRFQIEGIVLAGYLRHIPAEVIHAFPNRILNIHPSLLPAFGGHGFYGMRVHKAVLAYGCKISGATVHLVDEHFDTGPVVLQDAVPVLDSDTPETLAARVLSLEHELLPAAVRLLASGQLRVEGRRVFHPLSP